MIVADIDKAHEVGGLQEDVSTLESADERHELTLVELERSYLAKSEEACLIQSVSFRVFYKEVKPVMYRKLLPLCLDLDTYLVASSGSSHPLEFNLQKYPPAIIYGKLKKLFQQCFSETLPNWYYQFLIDRSNLDSVEAMRKGFSRC